MVENIANLMDRDRAGERSSLGQRLKSSMLVLSRRAGEAIVIGGNIEVFILGTDGGQVRVGIRAPRDVLVVRKELIAQALQEQDLMNERPEMTPPFIGPVLPNS